MKEKCFKIDFSTVISILIVLYGLCRCFFFNTHGILLLLMALAFFSIIYKGEINVTWYDMWMIFIALGTLLNRNLDYPITNCLFPVLAVLLYFNTRSSRSIKPIMVAIIGFTCVNLFATLLNIAVPNTYFKLMKCVLSSTSYNDAVFYYNNFGFLSGLSDHYSRNAYFCVLAATIAAAYSFSHRDKHHIKAVYMIVSIVLIMVIGKRGHLLFLIASMVIVYVLLAPSISGKVLNILKILISILIVGGILIETVPAVSYVFERSLLQKETGDISTGRFELWSKALELFKAKPFTGWGYGYYNTHVFNETLQVYFAGVHNDYLQWLCEQGIVGFVINMVPYIGIYILSLGELKKVKQIEGSTLVTSLIWAVLFQTFVLLYSLTGLPHYDYEVNIVYAFSLIIPIIILNENPNLLKVRRKRVIWKR